MERFNGKRQRSTQWIEDHNTWSGSMVRDSVVHNG